METLRAEEPFNPEMLLGNLVMVEFHGEGYYSGNTESQVAFFQKYDYDEICSAFESYTPSFCELDGKHSEVVGNVRVVLIDSMDTFKQCISSWDNRDDDYMIFESCLECSEYSDRVDMLVDEHHEITQQFSSSTETKYYVNEVEI